MSFDHFAEAASRIPQMRRAPAGSRGQVPNTTLLLPDVDGISLDTGALITRVPADRPWTKRLAVDARQLILVCNNLKKIGAAGGDLEIALSGRALSLKVKTTTVSIPTYRVSDP